MTVHLKLTNGASDLFDFTGTNSILENDAGGWDRSQWDESSDEVSESLHIMLSGGLTTIQTNLETIEKALRQAVNYYQERRGDPVYLEVKLVDDAGVAYWRSLMTKGAVTYFNLDSAIKNGIAALTISINRLNFFEATAETNLPLANDNVIEATTDYLPIFNCLDLQYIAGQGTRNNAVEMEGSAVTGTLPAPVKLSISTTGVGGDYIRRMWAFHDAFGSYPNSWLDIGTPDTHLWFEGESGFNETLEAPADANASGGYGVVTSSSVSWNIDTTKFKGNWYRLFARIKFNTTGTLQLTTRVYSGLKTDYAPYQEEIIFFPFTLADTYYIAELGTFRVPDGSPLITQGAVEIIMGNAPGYSITVDWFMMAPTDSWRYMELPGFVTTIQDDAIAVDPVVTAENMPAAFMGTGIFVEPGRRQRIYFIWENTIGSNAAGLRAKVKASCRLRKRQP